MLSFLIFSVAWCGRQTEREDHERKMKMIEMGLCETKDGIWIRCLEKEKEKEVINAPPRD